MQEAFKYEQADVEMGMIEKVFSAEAEAELATSEEDNGLSDIELDVLMKQLPKSDRHSVEVQLNTIDARNDIRSDLCEGGCSFNIWTPTHEAINEQLAPESEPVANYWLDDPNVIISTPFLVIRFGVFPTGELDRNAIWCHPGTKYADIPPPLPHTILGRVGGLGAEFHSMIIGNKGENLIQMTEDHNLEGMWHFNREDYHLDAYILVGKSNTDGLANVRNLARAADVLTSKALEVHSTLLRRPSLRLCPRMYPILPRATTHQPHRSHHYPPRRHNSFSHTRPERRRSKKYNKRQHPRATFRHKNHSLSSTDRSRVGVVTNEEYPPLSI